MKKYAKSAIAAALLLALAACQGGAVETTTPSDGAVPADASPADGSYPGLEEVAPDEQTDPSPYPSPS
jgi:hypothetical protein